MGSQMERMRRKVVAGGPSEVVDCGAAWVRLQLLGKQQLADKLGGTKGERDRPCNPRAPVGK